MNDKVAAFKDWGDRDYPAWWPIFRVPGTPSEKSVTVLMVCATQTVPGKTAWSQYLPEGSVVACTENYPTARSFVEKGYVDGLIVLRNTSTFKQKAQEILESVPEDKRPQSLVVGWHARGFPTSAIEDFCTKKLGLIQREPAA